MLSCYVGNSVQTVFTALLSPRGREVVGSIAGRDRPKSVKLVVLVAFSHGAQDNGNSTTTGPPVS